MKCFSCGNELNEGQMTCPYCGNSVSNANPTNQVNQWQNPQGGIPPMGQNEQVQNNYQPNNFEPNQNDGKKSNMVGIIIAIIVLIAAGVGVYFIAFNGSDKSNDTNKENNIENNEINVNNEEENIPDNTKKTVFIDTASSFVYSQRTQLNMGTDYQFYSTDELLMIPVGNDKKSCAKLEAGGISPFSKTWNYAYVAVTFDGAGYNYYFIGEDGEGNGMLLTDQMTLQNKNIEVIYSKNNKEDKSYLISLKDQYLKTSDSMNTYDKFENSDTYKDLLTQVERSTIVFVRADACKYKS